MRDDFAGAGDTSLNLAGHTLIALHDWTFLLGPQMCSGLGNGLLLGYLMYRSALVPRGMAMLGLIGGPLIVLSGTAILLGVIEAGSTAHNLAVIPEFFWELSFGVYLIVKGFKPSAITPDMVDPR